MDLLLLGIAISGLIAWIATQRARRRMGKALGREVKANEVHSLTTWMAVDEAEKQRSDSGKKP